MKWILASLSLVCVMTLFSGVYAYNQVQLLRQQIVLLTAQVQKTTTPSLSPTVSVSPTASPTPTVNEPTATPTVAQNTGMQIYSNENYGISFSYPKNFIKKECPIDQGVNILFLPKTDANQVISCNMADSPFLTLTVVDKNNKMKFSTNSLNDSNYTIRQSDVVLDKTRADQFIFDLKSNLSATAYDPWKRRVEFVWNNNFFVFTSRSKAFDPKFSEILNSLKTNPVVPKPTVTPNANLSSYRNDVYKFSFDYPNVYKLQDIGGSATSSDGKKIIASFAGKKEQYIEVIFDSSTFSTENLKKYASTGNEDFPPTPVAGISTQFYYYGPGGGGVCYPDQYFTKLNNGILIFRFLGCEDDKTPSATVKSYALQIMKSFKLDGTINNNVKTISYSLPQGWSKVKLLNSIFNIGYDPSVSKIEHNTNDGLYIWSGINQSIYDLSVAQKPYDGGSRHTFIYKTIGGDVESDKLDSYHEREYKIGGKNCLFLVGIQPSQSWVTWGMCPTTNGNAVVINLKATEDSDIEKVLGSISFN